MKTLGLPLTSLIRYLYSVNVPLPRICDILNRLNVRYSISTVKTQISAVKRGAKGVPFLTEAQKKAIQQLIDAPSGPLPELNIKNDEVAEIVPENGKLEHHLFKTLLKFCKARVNVWLVGPAGSGKTTAAQKVAEELELPFYFNGAIDSEYKLLGFIDAQGRVINKPFRKAFEHGGVYLFDEIDASLPGAVLAFNAALANGRCDFPDGEVIAHKDFVCIAAANTFDGTGEFVGRLKQDAAFLDRFASLTWGYDEFLERALMPKTSQATAWCQVVQRCRVNAKKHGMRVTISPRASIFGAKLLAGGIPQSQVLKSCIQKGMNDDQMKLVVEGVFQPLEVKTLETKTRQKQRQNKF